MFDRAQFIADCQQASAGNRASRDVREVVARAISDPAAVLKNLGEPGQGGLAILHRSSDLTVLNVQWPAGMVLMPHDHRMWAVIGIYNGREDNILWRRLPGGAGRIEAAGAKSLGEGEALALGPDVIHSVLNPLGRVTGALHVYGGDFFAVERSEWDPEDLSEKPYDLDKAMARFAGA